MLFHCSTGYTATQSTFGIFSTLFLVFDKLVGYSYCSNFKCRDILGAI